MVELLRDFPAAIARIEASASNIQSVATPTRYPYTYAYDYIRCHTIELGCPREYEGSRAQVAGWVRRVCQDDQAAIDLACTQLADAYLRENHILPA